MPVASIRPSPGRPKVDAISTRDYSIMRAGLVVFSLFVVGVNLLMDLVNVAARSAHQGELDVPGPANRLGPGEGKAIAPPRRAVHGVRAALRTHRQGLAPIRLRRAVRRGRVPSGVTHKRILLRHVLPNIAGPIVVVLTLWIATAIRLEATLSFLGLSTQAPKPSWGNIIRDGLDNLFGSPWPIVSAGAAITMTALAFSLIGDAVRDVLDPESRD